MKRKQKAGKETHAVMFSWAKDGSYQNKNEGFRDRILLSEVHLQTKMPCIVSHNGLSLQLWNEITSTKKLHLFQA